ncbi:MAG TPA: hypothetical protein VGH15_12195 [Caulobacteraceae bacterium]|jgi:hypothetical protein
MRAPTPADFLARARLAEARAARATNAALKEALLKVAVAWRRLIPAHGAAPRERPGFPLR